MKKILVPFGCRSDIGLSEPIVKRMREKFDVELINLFPQKFGASYIKFESYCDGTHGNKKPDLVFCTGDRVEMCAAACAAFHNGIPIAHYYAGCINEPPTVLDDTNRHCITLWSTIQFVENRFAEGIVWDLKKAVYLPTNIHVVGISHLDDLVIDESKVPIVTSGIRGSEESWKTSYDLYLINYVAGETLTLPAFGNIGIQIGGNPDGDTDKVPGAIYYKNLPRAQFLGLLKNCERFITNSSAAYYEAPYFLKPEQIIMIGNRNRRRHAVTMNQGASDKIVKILERYLNDT